MHRAPRVTLRPGVIDGICGDLDISRDELARRIGVSSSLAYRIDNGRMRPGVKFIGGLLATTGRPFDELFEVVT